MFEHIGFLKLARLKAAAYSFALFLHQGVVVIPNMAQAELGIDLQTSTLTVSADYLKLSVGHPVHSAPVSEGDTCGQFCQDRVTQAVRVHVLNTSKLSVLRCESLNPSDRKTATTSRFEEKSLVRVGLYVKSEGKEDRGGKHHHS
jgi:hypothetical protein